MLSIRTFIIEIDLDFNDSCVGLPHDGHLSYTESLSVSLLVQCNEEHQTHPETHRT
jgi:hypothetical protein